MSVTEILDTAQYVVDRHGKQTAVLLDLSSWEALRLLLEELDEDDKLGQLMDAVKDEERLNGEAAKDAYQLYLEEADE